MTRTNGTVAAALLGVLAACSFSYRNPAEALAAGEAGGRTVSDAGVLDGVAVSLKGSALDATSRANGRFAMLPLPAGRHTLLFRSGTERALQRDVEIGWGKDGQPQGVWMGDLAVPAAAAIVGSLGAPAGVALPGDGLVVDEASGTSAIVAGGAFTLGGLAIGEHVLRVHALDAVGNAYVGGPRAVTLGPDDAGTVRALASPIELHRATAETATVLVRLRAVGASVAASQLQIVGLPPSAHPVPDSTGLAQVEVREGRWTVGLRLPAGVTDVVAPPPVTFVAVAGDTVDLGTLYAVGTDAVTQAALSCHSDGDCAPGGSCSAGACQSWSPPAAAPASAGLCDPATLGCSPGPLGGVLDHNLGANGPPFAALCVAGIFEGGSAAVACGACCTPDGVAQICGQPGLGGCPDLATAGPCSADGWCTESAAGSSADLAAVWGSSATDAWAVGAAGTLLHWNGAQWISVGTGQTAALHGIWGAAADDAWIVGDGGLVLHWDGVAWAATTSPSVHTLRAVAGGSSSDVWAVGDGGTIARFEGVAWTPVLSGTTADLTGVWAAPTGEVFAVGNAGAVTRGVLLRRDAGAWTTAPFDDGPADVWGSSASDVWVARLGGLSRWNGAAWSAPGFPLAAQVRDVWGTSPLDVWAAGDSGGLAHWSGAGWTAAASGTTADLLGLWAASPDDVWAVGASGAIVHLSR